MASSNLKFGIKDGPINDDGIAGRLSSSAESFHQLVDTSNAVDTQTTSRYKPALTPTSKYPISAK